MLRTTCFIFSLIIALIASPVWAAEPAEKNAQVIVNALHYVYELQSTDEELTISALYDPLLPESKTEADAFAKAISQLKLRSGQALNIELVTMQAFLNGTSGKVLYVPQRMENHHDIIYKKAKERHLFTASTDRRCVEGKCCILAVQTDQYINIYLNERTLRDLGFSVNATFKFMVKRI